VRKSKDSEDMRGHNHETPAVAAGVISAYASEILACLQILFACPAGQIAVLLQLGCCCSHAHLHLDISYCIRYEVALPKYTA